MCFTQSFEVKIVARRTAGVLNCAVGRMHESAHFLVCAGKANEASVVLAKIAVHNNVVFDGLSDSAVGYNNSNRMSVAAQMSYLLYPLPPNPPRLCTFTIGETLPSLARQSRCHGYSSLQPFAMAPTHR